MIELLPGGPLFTEAGGVFTQLGIVSYGYGCATHLPGVYTRLDSYTDWVRNITKEDNSVDSYTASAILPIALHPVPLMVLIGYMLISR